MTNWQWTAEGSVLAPSVCGFSLCMKYLGNRGTDLHKFKRKKCLIPRSGEFQGQGQRSRSPWTKNGIFQPFRWRVCRLCLAKPPKPVVYCFMFRVFVIPADCRRFISHRPARRNSTAVWIWHEMHFVILWRQRCVRRTGKRKKTLYNARVQAQLTLAHSGLYANCDRPLIKLRPK